MEELIYLDRQFFLYLNNLGTPSWDVFWLIVTDKKTWIPLYLLIIYYLMKKKGPKKTLLTVVCIALMIACTDGFTNLLKEGIARLRPCHNSELDGFFRLVKSYCGGLFGFSSAHASNHMALAWFFAYLFRKHKVLTWIFFFWAFLIAYSRIYLGVHYPLDILVGIGVGTVSAFIFMKLFSTLEKRITIKTN